MLKNLKKQGMVTLAYNPNAGETRISFPGLVGKLTILAQLVSSDVVGSLAQNENHLQ